MSRVLDITLPLFAIIFLGYFVRRSRLLADNASEVLNGFVYWIALPSLLLVAIAKRPLEETFNAAFVGAWVGSILLTFALAAIFARVVLRHHTASACVHGFNASVANTAYIGVPMFAAAYGALQLAPAILGSLLNASVLMGLVIGILEITSRGHASARKIITALLRNPLLIAASVGIACSFFNVRLPPIIDTTFGSLGSAAGPCALFAMGLFLGGRSLSAVFKGSFSKVSGMVIAKLLIHPVLAWVLAIYVFPMDRFWTGATIILAALPTGSLSFVIAQQYGIEVENTSTTILITTALSIATLPFLLAVYT